MTRIDVAIPGLLLLLLGCADPPRESVLIPDGAPRFTLMDFASPPSLDPVSPGWYHHEFRRHPPMDISFVSKEDRSAIRLATHDSASMLFRWVDVGLDRYPVLSWDWYIEVPIEIDHDDLTTSGADQVGRWHHERLDLKELYETLWGSSEGARLVEVAIFCDTDETGSRSTAYFADIRAEKSP